MATLTPIAFYDSPAPGTAVAGFGSTLLVVLAVLAGGLLFEPGADGPARTTRGRYDRLRSVLGDCVATRSVLEVLGSRGSVWKVLFSMGIAVGTLFGLGAFTVVAVPLVVAALAATTAPTTATAVALGVALVAALVGVGLARRAGPRWDDRTRLE